MTKNQNTKKSGLNIIEKFNPALVSNLMALGLMDPSIYPLISVAQSVLSYFAGEYANNKTIDLLKEFKKNESILLDEIMHSDKFKAVFIRIISDNITEGNEEKRKYIKNYILNFACGIESDFNEHSKLINILNNITIDEINFLKLWCDDEIINDQKDKLSTALAVQDIGTLVQTSQKQYDINFDRDNLQKNNQILLSLGNKGLLYVLSRDNWGSGEEVRTHKKITEFGRTFLKFINR